MCVLKLDSVAKPFPQMLQWKGRFLARSTCASWFRRCCCKLLNWMKARPQSDKWHLYGRSPGIRRICKISEIWEFPVHLLWLSNPSKIPLINTVEVIITIATRWRSELLFFATFFSPLLTPFLLFFKCSFLACLHFNLGIFSSLSLVAVYSLTECFVVEYWMERDSMRWCWMDFLLCEEWWGWKNCDFYFFLYGNLKKKLVEGFFNEWEFFLMGKLN